GGTFASDVAGAVNLLRDRLDFVTQRHLVGIEKTELGPAAVGDLDDGAGKIGSALAAPSPVVGDDRLDALLGAQLLELRVLRFGIGAEPVDRHDRRDAKAA